MSFFDLENISCSMFHSLKGGTVEHENEVWNTVKNKSETKELKSLACNVLLRNKRWNKTGTAIKKDGTENRKNTSFCSTSSKQYQSVGTSENKADLEENLVSLNFLKKLSLKCRRCFNWKGDISRKGICSITQERKSHIDFCMDYNDTAGGVYAHSRRD